MTDRRGLITLAEAARMAGLSIWSTRQKLEAIRRRAPNVLQHFTPPGKPVRKWWVSKKIWAKMWVVDSFEPEEADSHASRIDRIERRLAIVEGRLGLSRNFGADG